MLAVRRDGPLGGLIVTACTLLRMSCFNITDAAVPRLIMGNLNDRYDETAHRAVSTITSLLERA
jgi:hypothetical protein